MNLVNITGFSDVYFVARPSGTAFIAVTGIPCHKVSQIDCQQVVSQQQHAKVPDHYLYNIDASTFAGECPQRVFVAAIGALFHLRT